MTPAEAVAQIDALWSRKTKLAEKIVDAARPIVPVLLDAGRANSAKALQELLFEFDAIEQEATQIVERNISPEFLQLMLRTRGGK